MKRRTRNYAKRQLTWMRRLDRANLLDGATDPADRLVALVKEEEEKDS
jgi:tRNA A37 N6-isopentenylltransferase MiaA